jgi:uncharacterized integral membrane protein
VSNTTPGAQPPKTKSGWTPKRIVVTIVAAYCLILVLLNLHRTSVDFVFFSARAPLLVLILVSLAVGFALGWLFDDIRAARRAKQSASGTNSGSTSPGSTSPGSTSPGSS